MADISCIQKEDLENSNEAMEAEDDEEVNNKLGPAVGGTEICSGEGGGEGGGGDEGGGEQQCFQVALTRLQQHATSEANFNRQMVGRILVEIFRAAVNNGMKLAVNDVMQPVQEIVKDPDAQVRSDLVEQLPHVAIICQEAPHLFGDVLHHHLLRIILTYLQDLDNQVRQTAQTALLALIKRGLLDNNTIEDDVCPVVEVLSYMPAEFQNSGISLMSKMAPLIGRELTEKLFLDRYIALCEDNTFYVRRICAAHFGEICAAVGREALFRRLFPTFVDLCCDSIWGVRKACVDVMMPVSCCLTLQYRRVLLAEILATHLKDDSKWVRISALQILGPFISTFAKQFTDVTYNQHGELVFTSQQDTHLSIRYSYEGIFPTKCAIRSQTLDIEDYTTREDVNPSAITQKLWLKTLGGREIKESDLEACKSKIQKKHLENVKLEDTNDTEKYNPFLYYYIPPDLPLDEELVQAAKESAANNKMNQKSPSAMPTNVTNGQTSVDDLKLDSSIEQNNEKKSDTSTSYAVNEKKNEDSDSSFLTSGDTSNFLNDTIDISNLSVDKSNFSASVLNKKQETMSNAQEIVPQDLVDYFVSMAEPGRYVTMGGDIPLHCAFSFPAVALTLGKENWPCLKKAYQSLASANQWKVRRTLASSIHEISMILGEELTATDLIPIYDGFIKDLDEVRIGVLKHLATFLKILKPIDRYQYLPRLNDFLVTDNEWNWRFREELATQLLEAVTLFSPSDVAQHIGPLSLQLLVDKVAAVRHVALSLITRIVSHLSVDEALVTALIQELSEMLAVNTDKWTRRQTYALLCAQLISSGAISGERFSKEMLPNLLNLSWDKVPNVRLAVARTLARNVITMGLDWLGAEQAEEVERRLKQMRLDPDRDVRMLAGSDEHAVLDMLPQNKTEQRRNILV